MLHCSARDLGSGLSLRSATAISLARMICMGFFFLVLMDFIVRTHIEDGVHVQAEKDRQTLLLTIVLITAK